MIIKFVIASKNHYTTDNYYYNNYLEKMKDN